RVFGQHQLYQIAVLSKTIVHRLTLRVVPSVKFIKLFLRWLLVIAEIKPSKKTYVNLIVIGIIILGLSAQIASFFVDKSEKNPNVLKFFASEYINTKNGIETLSQKDRLSPDDRGFAELSEIGREFLSDEMKKQKGSSVNIPPILITSIVFKGGISMGDDNALGHIGFHAVHITNPKEPFSISIKKTETALEIKKNTTLFRWAGVIFSFGFFLQIISLIINNQFSVSRAIIPEKELNERILKIIEEKTFKPPL
ncbi:MAG: hypothetical protein M3388_00495, partial [Acidobacteriota bacterium]|nr:hypothetical protein [Acidobacteriota bacterium]